VPQLTVVFFDAGQGDCTLVSFPSGELMLIDCGSTKNSAVVKPQLVAGIRRFFSAGRERLDLVLVTHADEDHYNLLVPTMNTLNCELGEVRYGGDIERYQNKRESNRAYDWLKQKNAQPFGAAHFGGAAPTVRGVAANQTETKTYVLAANATGNPAAADGPSKNANSVVTLVEYRGYKVFLMGDATALTERFILGRVATTPAASGVLANTYATSLKMGHHGSDTSSCEPWVRALQPNALFLSADTKPFGPSGTGVPNQPFLEQVVSWSPKATALNSHGVTCFYAAERKFDVWQTTNPVCSTLWRILYNAAGTGFDAAGGSWFLTVKADGSVDVSST
jgi:beta-lactamase superfamily II metal-dependent hydrolase